MDRIPVGAIHELPLQHIEDGQNGRIAVGAVHGRPTRGARKERDFFLLSVPPSAPTVGELQSLSPLQK